MRKLCRKCGAQCCRYFCFEIDAPDGFEEFDDIRWFLVHEGISVHIDEGDWYISIANRCKMLDESNRCIAYADRPLICRRYDSDSCDATAGDYGYDALFETPEEIEEYARKVMGEEKYEREKQKARAKADRTALGKRPKRKKKPRKEKARASKR